MVSLVPFDLLLLDRMSPGGRPHGAAPYFFVEEFMLWFCLLFCLFPARRVRSGCASGFICGGNQDSISVMEIIVNGVGESMRSRLLFLRTTLERLRSLYEVTGRWCEVLRCRLISEVRVSRGWEQRAETSRFYGADVLSGSGTSTEPAVLTRAPDVISA